MSNLLHKNKACNVAGFFKSLIIGILALFLILPITNAQTGAIVPTGTGQTNFLKAYQSVFHSSDQDFHARIAHSDTALFPTFGEYSVYWVTSGADKGSFMFPDPISNLTSSSYPGTYNWKSESHLSIQYKKHPKKIAVFHSKILVDNYSINWEALSFRTLFTTFLENNTYYYIDEEMLASNNINDTTSLLIIPAFRGDNTFIDSLLTVYPSVGNKIKSYLTKGGTIYAEGNATYFLEAIGVFDKGSVNYNNKLTFNDGLLKLNAPTNEHPIGFASSALNNELYAASIPMVNITGMSLISTAAADNRPVIFTVSGANASGGRIICNLGIPTSGGIAGIENGSRQLQWTLNALVYAFSQTIDVSRSVKNDLPSTIASNPNFVSYDRLDTFDVKIVVRNLSNENISNIQISEDLRNYFKYYEMVSSDPYNEVNGKLNFSFPLGPKTERIIHFKLRCPDPESPVYENVDKYIDYGTNMAASLNTTTYSDSEGPHAYNKIRNYADIMFSARLFGDADVNWKNFLGLDYQPFKVFMIMENKERTDALNTVYTQYIPKDVPFYWKDTAINIPILRSAGGQFVDVLKGSNDATNPDYDFDSDGKPDAWLDTASIFPKGYILTEEQVYWANPWEHLRTGNKKIVFEDIDHDGKVAEDTNGDGIVDIEEPGDKIRAWKVTWNIGTVKGYDYFDPYCSYELWIDPVDLVKLAAGVGYVHGKLSETLPVSDMVYPYTKDINTANKNDTTWTYWMDKKGGNVIWKQYILQHIQNYQGYTFLDTTTYELKPYDKLVGTTPQPHEEFIAVVSMGGEEIDMYHPTPSQSLYSKINYNTIFKEARVTPIRTTYTYYTPLPNPLQFEYLASNFTITDTLGKKLDYLPAKGKANLRFDLDASTEYTYYWIRNCGHKTDRKPEWIKDPVEGSGNGVFGYLIYEIPKGMGGYKITLPKKTDGSYDMNSIVQVDGKNFEKWLTNPNTGNEIEIWEDQFKYQIYIPQVLIPPALDDDNFDGVDDWIDDKGDRFESSTGYLQDPFMPGNGEDYPNKPVVPFADFGYGMVNSGWDIGADNAYGDDVFETLGKTHFTFNAFYEGRGREGSIDISKGGTLVVEEIFGGSPWVIFSHVLTGYAKGVDYKLTSEVTPSTVRYGTDTVFIKHTIEDKNEPHDFDSNFDPYHISLGYGEATITALAGGKDPCSLLQPAISTSTIIDPTTDHKTITLIPAAQPTNPDLVGYPRQASGTFLQVKVEVVNGSNDNWLNTTVKPVLTGLGNTKVELAYVAYPRPLVPAYLEGDKIIPGDQPGTFTTGWRFNQPEGEVLVKMGDTLNLMQPTRRGYYVFLFSIDENLKNGIYSIGFTMEGKRKDYKGNNYPNVTYKIPPVLFSITKKNSENIVEEYQKFQIDSGKLVELKINGSPYFEGVKEVKYTTQDVDYTSFNSISKTLPASYSNHVETINLTNVANLPNADTGKLYLFEKVVVNSYRGGEEIDLTSGQDLYYTHEPEGKMSVSSKKLIVSPIGPRILIKQRLYSVNGKLVGDNSNTDADTGNVYIVTRLEVINVGSDVSENTIITVYPGPTYTVLVDSLKSNITYKDGLIFVNLGTIIPGEQKYADIPYQVATPPDENDLLTVIQLSGINYTGPLYNSNHNYNDSSKVFNPLIDVKIQDVASSKIGEKEYTITVTAKNNGIQVKNAIVRIYAIVGVTEIPILEKNIGVFNTGQEITFTINYTLPNNEKIEVYAVIDEDETIADINKKNNYIVKLLVDATGINNLKKNFNVSVFPNPFSEKVTFAYNLDKPANDVNITVYNQNGSAVLLFANCPKAHGLHTIEWNAYNLSSGNYIYRVEIKNKDEKTSVITGKLVKN